MGTWKQTLRNTGLSLTVAAMGIMAAESAASAHDGGAPGDHVIGQVTGLGTDSFTITTHGGTTETIDTTAATAYAETGTTVPPTAVAVGEEVLVSLDPADTTPTAVKITVLLDSASGKVTAVTSTSITLSGRWDWSRDVVISPSTVYYEGTTSETGVTVGEFVTAFGTRDTTTPSEIDAQFVDIGKKTVCTFGVPPTVTPGATQPTTPGTDPGSGGAGWGTDPGNHPANAPTGATSTTTAGPSATSFHAPTAPSGSRGGAPTGGPGGGGFGPGAGQGGHGFSGGGAGSGSRGGRG
jgi:hypothetical protein